MSTEVTFLEMVAPPGKPVAPPRSGVVVKERPKIAGPEYLELYDGVGSGYLWTERKLMPAEELQEILDRPGVFVYVLEVDGEVAGYSELDAGKAGEVKLAYFGLFPAFVGRGLGKFFLNWSIARAWSMPGVHRLWVHTCDLDHPSALPVYRACGFRVYDRKTEEVALLPGP